MLRYYMTPETQQALIAESNRQIANRAALHASRRRLAQLRAGQRADASLAADDRQGPSESDSAFARLVCDLQSARN
jgi:hypothetical protein